MEVDIRIRVCNTCVFFSEPGHGHLFFSAGNFLASLLDNKSVSLKNSLIHDVFFIKLVLVNINHGKKL